ncbi:MAG: transporter, partial [Ignavibacteria bacterium]
MSVGNFNTFCKLLLFAILFIPVGSNAQKSGDEIAKQLANPIASLISVPFQSTFQFGIGGMDGYRYLMNLQPVIPVSLGKGLNLINRIIVPVVVQNRAVDMERQNGLGDILYSAFFSPTGGGLTWGIGPAFSI